MDGEAKILKSSSKAPLLTNLKLNFPSPLLLYNTHTTCIHLSMYVEPVCIHFCCCHLIITNSERGEPL